MWFPPLKSIAASNKTLNERKDVKFEIIPLDKIQLAQRETAKFLPQKITFVVLIFPAPKSNTTARDERQTKTARGRLVRFQNSNRISDFWSASLSIFPNNFSVYFYYESVTNPNSENSPQKEFASTPNLSYLGL